jgi:hypothetical protein
MHQIMSKKLLLVSSAAILLSYASVQAMNPNENNNNQQLATPSVRIHLVAALPVDAPSANLLLSVAARSAAQPQSSPISKEMEDVRAQLIQKIIREAQAYVDFEREEQDYIRQGKLPEGLQASKDRLLRSYDRNILFSSLMIDVLMQLAENQTKAILQKHLVKPEIGNAIFSYLCEPPRGKPRGILSA